MHYHFKALQKILSEVGTINTFSQRPVLAKFKQIANSTDPAEIKISAIDDEIKRIEDILLRIRNETTRSSKSVKVVMNNINQQITDALNLYLSAWNMLAACNKPEEKEEAAENIEDEEDNPENIDDEEPFDDEEEIGEGSEQIDKMINLAEEAEQMLMEIERSMTNLLSVTPFEG